MSGAGTDIRQIVTLKGTHFTGGLAQNAIESESIDFPTDWDQLSIDRCLIEGISLQADQALEWDIYVWGTDDYNSADLDAAELVDQINYPSTSGKRIAGAGQYFYASPTLEIPYRDENNTSKLHISLVNRSVTAKNAGATGEVVVRFTLRPVWGV